MANADVLGSPPEVVEDSKRTRMKEWRAANTDRIKAYQKNWRAQNAETVAQYQSAYHAEYKGRPDVQFETWVRNLRRNYKLTPDDFNRMWTAQAGLCAICDVGLVPRGRTSESVSVDHNHSTGAVRALLCRQCNQGLGHFKDDPDLLRASADYLVKHGNFSTHKEQS